MVVVRPTTKTILFIKLTQFYIFYIAFLLYPKQSEKARKKKGKNKKGVNK